MQEAEQLSSYQRSFKDFSASLNGGAKSDLHVLRQDAFNKFQLLGFPSTKSDAWKYTSLNAFKQKTYALAQEIDVNCVFETQFSFTEYAGLVKIVNGFVDSTSLSALSLPDGIKVTRLVEAPAQYSKLNTLLTEQQLPFVCLNTAFVRDVLFIDVAAGVALEQPLCLAFTNLASAPTASYPRVVIRIAKGASFSLVEMFLTENSQRYLTNFVEEIVLEEATSFKQVKIVNESHSTAHFAHQAVRQANNSTFESNLITFGGELVRNEVSVVVDGENAHCGISGLTLIGGEQHVDNNTIIEHSQPNSTSNQVFKGVYAGRSQGVFNGTIIVRQAAQKTNAIQSNSGLLLSADAALNSQPQLKIWADDVKCTHGATIGELDADSLYYLRSRGIAEDLARHILVQAFVGEVLQGLPFENLKQEIQEYSLERLNALKAN